MQPSCISISALSQISGGKANDDLFIKEFIHDAEDLVDQNAAKLAELVDRPLNELLSCEAILERARMSYANLQFGMYALESGLKQFKGGAGKEAIAKRFEDSHLARVTPAALARANLLRLRSFFYEESPV